MRTASHITNAPSAANARSIGPSDWLFAGVRQGDVHPGCESPMFSIRMFLIEVGGSAAAPMVARFVDSINAFVQMRARGDRASKLKPV